MLRFQSTAQILLSRFYYPTPPSLTFPAQPLLVSLRHSKHPEMLLGKRQRPPMKRTTSMTEFAADLKTSEEHPKPSDQEIRSVFAVNQQHPTASHPLGGGNWPREFHKNTFVATKISPRVPQRNSGDFPAVETAPFLRSCGLCSRRLAPGRDIFMYRGEIAFCSWECRQQQMNQDEKVEKWSLFSIKNSAPVTTDSSGTGETVAAA